MSLTSYRAAPPRVNFASGPPPARGRRSAFRLAPLAGPHDGYEPDELPGSPTPRPPAENEKRRGRSPRPAFVPTAAALEKPAQTLLCRALLSPGRAYRPITLPHERETRVAAERGGRGGVARRRPRRPRRGPRRHRGPGEVRCRGRARFPPGDEALARAAAARRAVRGRGRPPAARGGARSRPRARRRAQRAVRARRARRPGQARYRLVGALARRTAPTD